MRIFVVAYLISSLVLQIPLQAIDNNTKDSNEITKKENKYDKETELKLDTYKKVSLMDVVLETVSNSEPLKSAREQVIQSELKLSTSLSSNHPTLNFEYGMARTRASNSSQDSGYDLYNNRNYKFTLSQNLYSGGANSSEIKSLKSDLAAQKSTYTLALKDEIRRAYTSYFDVVFNYRALSVNERNMEKLNKVLDIVTIKYNNGALSIGDLTAIKASVSNARTSLVRVKSNLIKSLRYYEYIAGENFSETLPYEKNFNVELSSFDHLYERAIERNRTIVGFKQELESERYRLQNKQAAFAPKLDLEMTYDTVLEKKNFIKGEATFKGNLKLTYNLYNGSSDKNGVLDVYSSIRENIHDLNEEKKKLKWNVSEVYTSISSNTESMDSQISEVISSRKMVEAYWEGFKLGEQDLQILLNGQKQLNSAENNLIAQEKNSIIDFFTLLGYTGDLLAFFDIDPVHPKFIDFSKSTYTKDLYIDDKFLDEKEKFAREAKVAEQKEKINMLANQGKQEENIKAFAKEFLNASDENYTLDIGTFNNILEANKFIKSNEFDMLSFPYDVINGYSLDSKIAYGNFPSEMQAHEEMDKLKSKGISNDMEIKKVSDIKRLYNDYLSGLEVVVEPTPPEVKVIETIKTIEKIKQEKKKKVFELSNDFKEEFLSAPSNYYTINVSSFKSMKDVENLLDENKKLYDKSFAFYYSDLSKLVRFMYGIYPTYEEANTALEALDTIKDTYYPVIENIAKQQTVFSINKELNTKKPEPKKEYEYIEVSSQIEYKEPKIHKKSDDIKDEVLKEKVDKLLDITNESPNVNSEVQNNKSTDKAPIKVEDKVSLSDTPVVKLSEVDKYNNKEFKNKFLSVPEDYYTINIATLNKVERVGKFLEYYNIKDKSLVFTIGEKLDLIKVVYGVYSTRDDALDAIEKLPTRLIETSNPYIERIYRKQELYKSYHGEVSIKEEKTDENEIDTPLENNKESINTDKREEKLVVSNINNVDMYNNQEFKKEFLSAPKDHYTINVASLNKIERVGKFLEYYGLKDKAFVFSIGENFDQIKVMYGVYDSREKVLEAISNLPERLKKSNKPYREKIFRKQGLYNTYHGNNNANLVNLPKVENIIKDKKIEDKSEKNLEEDVVDIVDNNDKELLNKAKLIEDENLVIKTKNKTTSTVEKDEKTLLDKAELIKNEKLESNEFIKTYRVYISTVSSAKVDWFMDRYSIDPKNLIKVNDKSKIMLYLGDFATKEEANKVKDSLHPRLTKTKVITLGVK
jgi:outer membrane protein TolC/septal ring-binding cell division protein DamX